MPQSIDRLVYRSTAAGSTESLTLLAELLGEAQRNNARDGLTGALAAHDGQFLQVLEGTPAALDNLQRRLKQDRRHRDIVVLGRMRAEGRAFEGWSMASARITPALKPELDALMAESAPSIARVVGLMRQAVTD